MARLTERFDRSFWPVAVIFTALVLAFVVGRSGLGFREMVIFILGVGVMLVLLSPAALQWGFYFFILTFAIGWRQIPITDNLKIHPSEVVAWMLMFLIGMTNIINRRRTRARISNLWLVLALLSVVGYVVAQMNGVPWDFSLSVLKGFALALPTLFIVQEFVNDDAAHRRAVLILAGVVMYVSGLGIAEYFFPTLVAPFRGFFGSTATITSEAGFVREDFTFFGGAITSVFLAIALFPILGEGFASRGIARIFFLLTVSVAGLAVYLAGNRGSWIAFAFGLITFAALNSRRRWLTLGAMGAIVVVLPTAFYENLSQVLALNDAFDSSVLKRLDRAAGAWNLAQTSPLWGSGWGASGYVHSDLIQLAADLGFPFLAIFLIWVVGIAWKLLSSLRRANSDADYDRLSAFLAAVVASIVLFGGEGFLILPHVISPVWFVLALAAAAPVVLHAKSIAGPESPSPRVVQ